MYALDQIAMFRSEFCQTFTNINASRLWPTMVPLFFHEEKAIKEGGDINEKALHNSRSVPEFSNKSDWKA